MTKIEKFISKNLTPIKALLNINPKLTKYIINE